MQNPSAAPQESVDATRRALLRTGVLGSLLLGGAGIAASLGGCTRRVETSALGFRVLRDPDLLFLRALIPAVLGPLAPPAGAGRDALFRDMLERIDFGVYRLDHPAQKAALQLFDILNMRLTRWAMTGVGAWDQAGPAQVQAFLERWRGSSFATFNGGYRILIKLVAAAFYATPAGWAAANYPGPPPGPYQALNS